MSFQTVGKSVLRKDGFDKVTGRSRYIDDLVLPDMIYGATVRSPIARGKLRGISFEDKIPWSDITVVTAKDLPGPNCIAHITTDQQCLVSDQINHVAEPIALLAHADVFLLEKAKRNLKLDIKELPGVFSIEESLSTKDVIWGTDNTFKSILIEKGNVETAFSKADYIFEDEYSTGAQEQLYIETNGIVAIANPAEGVTVWGSMQCPYYIHKALITLFKLPKDKVRVIQMETGGGFGGKEDYPSVLACHAALLSWKSGKPVKMIYDRVEDIEATTKRHPSRTRHKTAITKTGKLLAMEIEFILDGGAYVTMSPVVLSRGSIHAAGPYNCPNIRIEAKAVATNFPPYGAFRGFGAPQSFFALERHLDNVAVKLGITPEEIRKTNFVKEGDLTATGQIIREKVDMTGLLETVLKKAEYHKKVERFREENKKGNIKRGIGFSAFMHGAGFTGSGEAFLASVAAVEVTAKGRVRVLASSTDIGQGARTVFAQIAASSLNIDVDSIDIPHPDTSIVPNSGPTVASRTTMVVGKLVESACEQLKLTLIQSEFLKTPYSPDEFTEACSKYISKFGSLKVFNQYKQPEFIKWDDQTYKGDAYGTFTWAVYLAEISVDTRTFETKVENFVAAQEVGKVVNPMLAEGQIQGGVIQGIGYTLSEKLVNDKGRILNNRMTNYIIPTAEDVPNVEVIFTEVPYSYGPSGAKGIGELPMNGVAPAILNAVQAATGISVNTIPMLPENLMTAALGVN